MIWSGTDIIVIEIQYTINGTCCNHSQTNPPTLENCLPKSWSLVPKTLGTTVVHHSDCFVCVEPFLCPWNKSHLIILYDPFNVLLNLVSYFVEGFCIYIHQGYWPAILFLVSLPHFGINVLWALYNEIRSFLLVFLNSLRRIGMKSSLNVW